MDIRAFRQERIGVAGHTDDRYMTILNKRQETQQLFGSARIGDSQQQVVVAHHTEIAVIRVQRIKEERGRACTRKGSRNLRAYMSRLADTGNHHFSFAVMDELHSTDEIGVQTRDKRHDSIRLLFETFFCFGNDRLFNHCASQNLNLVIITKGIPETVNQNGDKVETGRIVPIDFGKKYMDNIVDKVEFLGYIVPNKESSVVLFGNTEKSIGSVKIKNFPKKLEWNAETFLKAVDEATKKNKVTTSQTVLKQHMSLEECKEKLMQAVKDCEDKSKAKDIYSKYLDDTLPDNLVKSQIGNAERVIELLKGSK